MTRDVGGSFYDPGDWQAKHQELAHQLEKQFEVSMHDNGNSFDSCFQFVVADTDCQVKMRIKFYWKTLALIQTETV